MLNTRRNTAISWTSVWYSLSVMFEWPQSVVESYWVVEPKSKWSPLRFSPTQNPQWLVCDWPCSRTVGCQRLTDRHFSSSVHTVFETHVKKPRILSEQYILKWFQLRNWHYWSWRLKWEGNHVLLESRDYWKFLVRKLNRIFGIIAGINFNVEPVEYRGGVLGCWTPPRNFKVLTKSNPTANWAENV